MFWCVCLFGRVCVFVCVCVCVCESVFVRKIVYVCACVRVFVGGKKGGERVFEVAAGLCQSLLAHCFPSECESFAHQSTFLDSGSGYFYPSA